jgi:branched-chain amino acid transport system ATP-binding protein
MMLEAEKLCAWYGAAQILFDVSLTVGAGEVVALMGRNGSGKTTTMKAIMGLVGRRAGSVRFQGRDLMKLKTFQIAQLGVGWVPEDRRIFTELTLLENLDVGRRSANAGKAWTPERLFELFPNLAEMRERPGGRMSGGEQQMLTVARTLMGNPQLVLLDEPSEGVAPLVVERMADTILELKKEGLSVLLSEQNLHFAGAVSDRAYILERGHIGWAGSMSELEASPEVQRQLLAV